MVLYFFISLSKQDLRNIEISRRCKRIMLKAKDTASFLTLMQIRQKKTCESIMAVSYTSEVSFGTNHPGLGLSTSWLASRNNLFAAEAIAHEVVRYLGSFLSPSATCGVRRSTVANLDIGMVSGLNTSKDRDGTSIIGQNFFRKLSQGFTSTPWDSLQSHYSLPWNAWLECRKFD